MFPVTGLVFCGGGGRGAYQIGVWQALRERGLDKYTAAVSGASVGALNAALFACGDLPLAERVWTSLKRGDITDPAETAGRVINSVLNFLGSDDRTITIDPDRLSRGGIFSLEGLVNVIAENGVNDCVSGCGTPCFACCHNTEGNYPEYFDLSAYPAPKITQYLAASCALPAVFPAVDIDGTLYRDGGVSDNTPVKPLYDIGIRRFIVSYLGSGGADLSNFPGAEFIELFPSDEIFLGKRENSVIAPGTLDFDGENAALRIELGRRETLEQLSETDPSSFLPANISG